MFRYLYLIGITLFVGCNSPHANNVGVVALSVAEVLKRFDDRIQPHHQVRYYVPSKMSDAIKELNPKLRLRLFDDLDYASESNVGSYRYKVDVIKTSIQASEAIIEVAFLHGAGGGASTWLITLSRKPGQRWVVEKIEQATVS